MRDVVLEHPSAAVRTRPSPAVPRAKGATGIFGDEAIRIELHVRCPVNATVEGGSDQSFLKEFADSLASRLEATLVRNPQLDTGGPGTTRQFGGLVGRFRHRLLHENVLSPRDDADGDIEVSVGGCTYDHGIDVRIVRHVSDGAIPAQMRPRRRCQPRRIGVTDGLEPEVVAVPDSGDVDEHGRHAGSDNPDAG